MSFFEKYYAEQVTIRFISQDNEDEYEEFIIDPRGRSEWNGGKPENITEEEDNFIYSKMQKIEDIMRGED